MANTGDKIAFLTRLALTGEDGKPLRPSFYSDNWFSLLPGESKTVTVSHPAKPFKLSVSAWNARVTTSSQPHFPTSARNCGILSP